MCLQTYLFVCVYSTYKVFAMDGGRKMKTKRASNINNDDGKMGIMVYSVFISLRFSLCPPAYHCACWCVCMSVSFSLMSPQVPDGAWVMEEPLSLSPPPPPPMVLQSFDLASTVKCY